MPTSHAFHFLFGCPATDVGQRADDRQTFGDMMLLVLMSVARHEDILDQLALFHFELIAGNHVVQYKIYVVGHNDLISPMTTIKLLTNGSKCMHISIRVYM